MAKLSLVAFYVKACFLALISWIVKFFSEDKAKELKIKIGKKAEKLGIKAIKNKWCAILKKHMRLFCNHSAFQRELILANHICDEVLFDMFDAIEVGQLTKDNLCLLFATRKFHRSDFSKRQFVKVRLKWFQEFDHKDINSADRDLTKFFYKQCGVGEDDIYVARCLARQFDNDEQFIVWQAIHKAKGDIIAKFLDNVFRDNNVDLLKKYVKKCGIKDCNINDSTGMHKMFLECRSEMTSKEDILVFEKHLLKGITLYGEDKVESIVRNYGLQLESLPDLLDLLAEGYTKLLRAYKLQKDPKACK